MIFKNIYILFCLQATTSVPNISADLLSVGAAHADLVKNPVRVSDEELSKRVEEEHALLDEIPLAELEKSILVVESGNSTLANGDSVKCGVTDNLPHSSSLVLPIAVREPDQNVLRTSRQLQFDSDRYVDSGIHSSSGVYVHAHEVHVYNYHGLPPRN